MPVFKKKINSFATFLILFFVFAIFTAITVFVGLVPDAQARDILKGERLPAVAIKAVDAGISINDAPQYRIRVRFTADGQERELNTRNLYSYSYASNLIGNRIEIYYKNGKVVGADYNGELSTISLIAIIFIILDCALIIGGIIFAASKKKKSFAANKKYKVYTWGGQKTSENEPSYNSAPSHRNQKEQLRRMKEHEARLKGNVADNTVNLDNMPDNFSKDIKTARTPTYDTDSGYKKQDAANIKKTPIIDTEHTAETNTAINLKKNSEKALPPVPVADLRPANITDISYDVLEKMRTATSVDTLDELWTAHSNHMPFSDYIAVKREYENIRRGLK